LRVAGRMDKLAGTTAILFRVGVEWR